MNATPVKRKLAAILATDAVGYSRMMAADDEGTMKVLSAHRSVTDGSFTLKHGEAGQPESFQLSGVPQADGRLQFAGGGFTGNPSQRQKSGQPYKAAFDGRFEGPRYQGTGQLGAQECALAVTRAP